MNRTSKQTFFNNGKFECGQPGTMHATSCIYNDFADRGEYNDMPKDVDRWRRMDDPTMVQIIDTDTYSYLILNICHEFGYAK